MVSQLWGAVQAVQASSCLLNKPQFPGTQVKNHACVKISHQLNGSSVFPIESYRIMSFANRTHCALGVAFKIIAYTFFFSASVGR